jgi:hypothetical protein
MSISIIVKPCARPELESPVFSGLLLTCARLTGLFSMKNSLRHEAFTKLTIAARPVDPVRKDAYWLLKMSDAAHLAAEH